ncbi:MAG: phosphoenolpyruvate--protein phosphotransferase [Sphingomonadaceae bacterium]|nr:phosphoenolpyruvate--protein phosphotransferase [Sphingomonadaceae bacterium]
MSEIIIHAPFAALLRPLSSVPDPVFAEKMVGDGVALEPLGEEVFAPFAGRVMAVAPTGHSLTLRGEVAGRAIDILLHIGIDSVAMAGAGFEPLVGEGDVFAAGDPLLRFDLDQLALGAAATVTPILCTNNGAILRQIAPYGRVDARAPIFAVSLPVERAVNNSASESAHLIHNITLPHGIHARPAARITAMVRDFGGQVRLSVGASHANGASSAELLALGARHGDELHIRAIGDEPRRFVVALSHLLDQLATAEAARDEGMSTVASGPLASASKPGQVAGVRAAPGLAIGPVWRADAVDAAVPESSGDAPAELSALEQALAALRTNLTNRAAREKGAAREILEAHLSLTDDPALHADARAAISVGRSAAFAWRAASRAMENRFAASDVARLRERAVDLRDVERQLLALLLGDVGAVSTPPKGAIVLAEDIAPSLLINAPAGQFGGVALGAGGATSHAAILAAAKGLPMLVALGAGVDAIADGAQVILDADHGLLDGAPDATALSAAQERMAATAAAAAQARAAAGADCQLACGTRIEVFANLGNVEEAAAARAAGAEGCGLLRSEFLFLERDTAPDVDAQAAAYGAIARALDGRPLIIRTLDVGGDKPISYLPFAAEENPALGARGIRFSLARPDLLDTQLRAMLRAVPAAQLRIMLPMVVDVAEVTSVRHRLDALAAEEGVGQRVPLGIMVETPAAAMLATDLAAEVDFLSIGSNDLAQYMLAMDRTNAALATRLDALHPAVLRAMAMAARGAAAHGRWLGICGGLAADPIAAPLLVGLGCSELSGSIASIAAIKAALSRVTMDQCRALAAGALTLHDAGQVRALLQRGM